MPPTHPRKQMGARPSCHQQRLSTILHKSAVSLIYVKIYIENLSISNKRKQIWYSTSEQRDSGAMNTKVQVGRRPHLKLQLQLMCSLLPDEVLGSLILLARPCSVYHLLLYQSIGYICLQNLHLINKHQRSLIML